MAPLILPHRKRHAVRRARHGISLLEVLMATVLLLGAVMALSRLAFLARRHATSAEDQTQAQLLCHNLMQEIVLGVRPAADVAPTSFADDQWAYSIDVEPVDGGPLSCITVRVARLEEESSSLPTADEMGGFRLVRWLRTGQSQSPSPGGPRRLGREANP